jgi:hypothetical protein
VRDGHASDGPSEESHPATSGRRASQAGAAQVGEDRREDGGRFGVAVHRHASGRDGLVRVELARPDRDEGLGVRGERDVGRLGRAGADGDASVPDLDSSRRIADAELGIIAFTATAEPDRVGSWLGGLPIAMSAVAAHYLGELAIKVGGRRPWRILRFRRQLRMP